MAQKSHQAFFKKATLLLYWFTGFLAFIIIIEIVGNHLPKEKDPPRESWYRNYSAQK